MAVEVCERDGTMRLVSEWKHSARCTAVREVDGKTRTTITFSGDDDVFSRERRYQYADMHGTFIRLTGLQRAWMLGGCYEASSFYFLQ